MRDAADIARIAEALDQAERTRTPMRQLSKSMPDLSLAEAYAIQEHWVQAKCAAGAIVKGHKIGLTSRAMQTLLGIDEPDYGVLLDDMFLEPGAAIPRSRFIAPKLEVELAFLLRSPLKGPGCTLFDVLRATEYIVPALEIIDSRTPRVDPETGMGKTIIDNIADNAGNAALILGGSPVRPDQIDLRWSGALLHVNGTIEETGLAAGVLGHPATGIAWLANKLAAHGVTLEAGEVVLAGAFTRALDMRAGDQVHADFGRLGSIFCRFV